MMLILRSAVLPVKPMKFTMLSLVNAIVPTLTYVLEEFASNVEEIQPIQHKNKFVSVPVDTGKMQLEIVWLDAVLMKSSRMDNAAVKLATTL